MTALLIVLSIILIAVVAIQIGRVADLATKIRGEEEMQEINNRRQGSFMLVFLPFFLVLTIGSGIYFRNYMFGFGAMDAASEHGPILDRLFNITLFFTGIVFIITQIALFYFAFKYRGRKGKKADFIAHDNKLEIVWTLIPAVVMTFLVIGGLDAWNEVMADVGPDEDYVEIEATGYQFGWAVRYPGPDGKIGEKDFQLISGNNPLGQNWEDEKNIDDFQASEIYLPVNKKVRVRITSKDVLHNFYLPHFRVKMDAVPGMPTYFVFTPTKTTEDFRKQLSQYPEYQIPADPEDPKGPKLWEAFDYELACAELCGRSHFAMRLPVKVVSEQEYEAWTATQPSYYMSTIRNTDEDPYKDRLFESEISSRKAAFNDKLETALGAESSAEKVFQLDYVTFETGSANLTPLSSYELDNIVEAMGKYTDMRIELAGHTDNTGEADANQVLSESRARTVFDYLVENGVSADRLRARGYGQNQPVDTNDTEDGRENNRRTEFRILAQ
jgi:cytochrome c oxidase subunit 2